jgi:hypothetical protein
VDAERFVKLFMAGLKQATGLSKAGLSIFEVVYSSFESGRITTRWRWAST